MKRVKTLLLFLILILIVGCSNSNESNFEGSSSFPDFPVPVDAEIAESRGNGYEKYLYNAIGNTGGIREDYYKIIESCGWEKELQIGSYYVIEKDGQFISMTIHGSNKGDFFTLIGNSGITINLVDESNYTSDRGQGIIFNFSLGAESEMVAIVQKSIEGME